MCHTYAARFCSRKRVNFNKAVTPTQSIMNDGHNYAVMVFFSDVESDDIACIPRWDKCTYFFLGVDE